MSVFEAACLTGCAFLMTYWLHSTLAVLAGECIRRCFPAVPRPEYRLLTWKLALTVPIFTAAVVTWGPIPHLGWQISLASWQPTAATVMSTGSTPESYHAASGDALTELAPVAALPTDVPVVARSTTDALTPRTSAVWLTHGLATLLSSRGVCWALAGWWLLTAVVGSLLLLRQAAQILRLRRRARQVANHDLRRTLVRLQQQLRVQRRVDLLVADDSSGPLTAGVWRPFILLPGDHCWDHQPVPASQPKPGRAAATVPTRVTADECEALLAHELAHVARHDAAWSLLGHAISRLFPQPLNRLALRHLRQEMDFVADALAVNVLDDRSGLARCLLRFSQRGAVSLRRSASPPALAAGMVSFHSTLGRRMECLLTSETMLRPISPTARCTMICLMFLTSLLVATSLPRVSSTAVRIANQSPTPTSIRNPDMKHNLSAWALLLGLSAPAMADEPPAQPAQQSTPARPVAELKATPDELPSGSKRFNGMLVGRLAAKDVERGTFNVVVDAVPRVWRNSNAENPHSLVGKTVQVSGVFGKFLDVLVVTKIGETVEFECKHDGDGMVFPGELLRKVAPYDPQDYPVLPEEFRGFRGAVVADIVKKDPETFELIVKVVRVTDTWKENDAKQPRSIEGKLMMLAGFWNRQEAYHDLKVGERIEVGMQHIEHRSDHLTMAEFVRKAKSTEEAAEMKRESEASASDGLTRELRGFRGMLVGRLVAKDVERGTFTILVDAVPRVWPNSQAARPKAYLGREANAEGVTGKMLDALIVAKIGDTIEFGALHDGGERLRVGEVLRKVAPVEPGAYPELPDDFRGFKGMVVAKVIRKDDHLLDLVVEIQEIKTSFPASRAKQPASMLGKTAMLSGFWQRKEAFHRVSVGDTIECGIDHPQALSDHLTVIESFKKLEK